ncbi:MAG: hypothetical protein GX082_03360 [Clostridiaceae bacterium]|jgi:hypothetical protein|nr:hypothetical protein [Clostridiaceae bacterium]
MKSIRNNLTIQGTISKIESVRIKEDAKSVFYITTAEINVDEVLIGTFEPAVIHIVCGAGYTGQIDDKRIVPAPGLEGCQNGTTGVFVLREPNEEAWSIYGKDVYPKSLEYYYIVYRLERSGNVLIFVEQGIELNIEEIH